MCNNSMGSHSFDTYVYNGNWKFKCSFAIDGEQVEYKSIITATGKCLDQVQ